MDAVKYYLKDGSTIERGYGKTPNGNDLGGMWVLRNAEGWVMDYSQYRYDIISKDSDIVKVDML